MLTLTQYKQWKSYNDLDVVYKEIDYGTIPVLVDNYYSILQVSE